ncbi:VOC family protein [Stratiformator vulcanicus]|uniref:Glyoxalase-like domain protein n=1 Tax=Stratiformator vulcanicus TaxID=2527980 RepID=A0A517R0H8_9PLAN|nr:VOC family protein [Stratiformator vulcanicus]QDT37334.1 Glyoxalase-like domain protein [Stratiformator vulcanicus]
MTANPDPMPIGELDALHHVAIEAEDIAAAVEWYRKTFRCDVTYQDDTWAMLKFANMSLALVTPGQHPMHIGFVTPEAESYGELKTHRDGTKSIYISDPTGNAVELLAPINV